MSSDRTEFCLSLFADENVREGLVPSSDMRDVSRVCCSRSIIGFAGAKLAFMGR
ncbi:hypothetical protein [Rhizobium alvei]|uniref:Uncharacterized protein n=1 Tax=Rhizobium alvei TaxID=1132659 RepID=A0ABT8YKY9_9HYPH|nr:hypothetical protein [Rhizobium alvei]MDO6964244.1 hypothetical protein [Rhizobium alvei]